MTGKWDDIYRQQTDADGRPRAAEVLLQNQHLLPKQGQALDLACGLGANALLLAEAGLQVAAWDSASAAIERLAATASAAGLSIVAEQRDVITQPPAPASLDVLVVSHFLHRDLCPALQQALRPGGLLFYQTWTRAKVAEQGPRNPDYLLQDNELLRLFPGLKIRMYREDSVLGDISSGWRNQAMLVAEA